MSAEYVTPDDINFMATHAKGLICMPCDGAILDRLQMEPMVANNTDNHETAFTVSIDHKDTTTGISAVERAYTIKNALTKRANRKISAGPAMCSLCAAGKAGCSGVPATRKPLRTCAGWPD